MIIKTEAIALNIRPYSESSQIVGWLTPGHGRIATIVKGAQRPRNIFLGQYDLFYTCELVFYLRRFQGLHIVKECFPLKARPEFRAFWPGTACASYFCGLAAKIAPLYAPHPQLYALLENALDFFAGQGDGADAVSDGSRPDNRAAGQSRFSRPGSKFSNTHLQAGLFWLELKLLDTLGYAPRLEQCLQCHRPMIPGEPGLILFSAARGGVVCGSCAKTNGDNAGWMAPDSFALLKFWQSAGKVDSIRKVVCSERQLKDVGAILGNFLQHHLETENTGRAVALSILGEYRRLAG